jgi:glucokinase
LRGNREEHVVLNVGIDIGGTKIAGGVVAEDGRIIERASSLRRTPPISPRRRGHGRGFALRHDVHSVGVAAAATSTARSIMMHAPNIDWHDVPLRAQFEERIGRPVTLENDANAAGWGSIGSVRGAAPPTW